jgi:hypothetical protein
VRYYNIQLLAPGGSSPLTRSDGTVYAWTSHPNGILAPPDPGALLVELELYVVGTAQVGDTTSYARVWGIRLDDIGQARNLNGASVVVSGGMGRGLPLANPAQAGPLMRGGVQQAFANWVGTSMTLDILFNGNYTGGLPPSLQHNISFNWPAGTPMGPAVQQALQTAYPDKVVTVDVSPDLVLPNGEYGIYPSVTHFGQYLNLISKRQFGLSQQTSAAYTPADTPDGTNNYPGVDIAFDPAGNIKVYDGTSTPTPKVIAFNDLVGQPTWISYNNLQVTCVMRSDINTSDVVTLPKTRVTVSSAAAQQNPSTADPSAPVNNNVIFQGTYRVQAVRHSGNYKDPSGLAWVTVLTCVPQPIGTGGQGSAPPNPNNPTLGGP